MHNELVVLVAIKSDPIFRLDPGQGKDIGNPIWVEPYCAISWEITDQISSGYPCCAMDIHVLLNPPDILEEPTVHEHIDGGLIIK